MENKFVVHPRRPAFGKTSVVSARLPDEMIKKLDEVAKQTGRTRNELIQMSIDFALKNLEISDE
ncbi:ribbon-helix-helix protein, CopG family [Intestinimonas butyriciproducens]|uniref:ribbon-helix-helix protein, CopG family n=1 Tax=Intestinimonas butyriciproducens TaxID=1297617 RepID=UPI00195C7B82|nr:ribbon-helix-helix protein, CopG family [Intestinimonas butyriciproducens]